LEVGGVDDEREFTVELNTPMDGYRSIEVNDHLTPRGQQQSTYTKSATSLTIKTN